MNEEYKTLMQEAIVNGVRVEGNFRIVVDEQKIYESKEFQEALDRAKRIVENNE